MYAVIETGGKQYRVSEGSRIRVERIDSEVGEKIRLDRVLALGKEDGLTAGRPEVAGAGVVAEVIAHGKGEKVTAYKYKRRKDSDRKVGHRQGYTELEISEIQEGGG